MFGRSKFFIICFNYSIIFFTLKLHIIYTLWNYYHIHSKIPSTGIYYNFYLLYFNNIIHGYTLIFGYFNYTQIIHIISYTHYNMNYLIGSSDLTYVANNQNIVLISQSSLLLFVFVINTHSPHCLIIIIVKNNNIIGIDSDSIFTASI